MSTPKSATISVKNPSTSIGLSPTDTRPLLLVTTDNNQQQPQTITVPNGRRLPLNGGRMATVISSKQRQQPTIPSNSNHQMINEITTQKMPPRKFSSNRPRTALFFTSTRMKYSINKSMVFNYQFRRS
jgi:hypothetical protein